MPVWRLEQIPVPTQPIVGPDGQVINQNARPGFIPQWCDLVLAAAWFGEAARRATAARQALSQNNAAGDDAAVAAMLSVLEAIAFGFNACNILWWNEPTSRALFWKYISGPPQARGGTGNVLPSEYERFVNFSDNWYGNPNQDFPGNNGSIISRQASRLWNGPLGRSAHPMQFVQTFGLWLQPTVDYAPQAGCNYQIADQIENVSAFDGFFDGRFNHCFHSRPQGKCVTMTGADCNSDAGASMGQARQMWFDESVPGFGDAAPLQFSPPPMYYLPWLEEWTAMLSVTRPVDLIARARAYVVYVNSQQAIFAGGTQQFIQSVISGSSTIQSEISNGSTQTALNAGAAAAAAIGGALATPTFGISALVGGATALVLHLMTAIVQSPIPPGVGRDDLGRYKPVLEPGWLGGNPGIPTQIGQPTIMIPDPPGWRRPANISTSVLTNPLFAVHQILGSQMGTQSSSIISPSAPSSSVSMTTVLVGAALAAAAAGAVYVATRPSPRRSSRTTRR
jgi:hypothetical protein